jgi:hypothetical protein
VTSSPLCSAASCRNAYQDDTSFLQIGTDLLARIGAVGMDAVAAELEAFLQEAAEHSGDDVTVAVVWLGR